MNYRMCFGLAAVLAFVTAPVFAYDWSANPGDGSADNPYQISTCEQLMAIGTDANLLAKSYVLTNDIVFDPANNPAHVFSAALIAPDVDNTDRFFTGSTFSGSFDGKGFRIMNLKFAPAAARSYVGLFGSIGAAAIIKHVDICGFSIHNACCSGGLAGTNAGMVSNCSASGQIAGVTARSGYGGLVGDNSGSLTNCRTDISMTGIERTAQYGGLVGSNGGLVDFCTAEMQMVFQSGTLPAEQIGGLTGYNGGEIRNSNATAHMTLVTNCQLRYIGGLIGLNQCRNDISGCSAQVAITHDGFLADIGGLIGTNEAPDIITPSLIWTGKIVNSSASGTINATGRIGGLIGVNRSGTVLRCFSVVDIEGLSDSGGLIGVNFGYYNPDAVIKDCYALGRVFGLQCVGGLIGYIGTSRLVNCCALNSQITGPTLGGLVGNVFGTNSISSCYFLDRPGVDNGFGEPVSDVLAKLRASFIGWDFLGESVNGQNEIWRMCQDGIDYPRLSWEFGRQGDFACQDSFDLADLQALAEQWLTQADAAPATFNYACDADADGFIGMPDLQILTENW